MLKLIKVKLAVSFINNKLIQSLREKERSVHPYLLKPVHC